MYGDSKDIEGTKTVVLGCNLILSILGKKDLYSDVYQS